MTTEIPDFLEYSRKLKLFSDNIKVKLPRSKENRDKQLLEYMNFTKEYTLIMSQICNYMHFSENDFGSDEEFTALGIRFWKQATWFENHAKLIRTAPKLFKEKEGYAELCEQMTVLCEMLGEYANSKNELRSTLRSAEVNENASM